MDRKQDKGKAKLIQPTKLKKTASSMSISSEEEKTEKFMSQSIRAQNIYSNTQRLLDEDLNKTIQIDSSHDGILQFYKGSLSQKNIQNKQRISSYAPKNLQSIQSAVYTFGNYALQKCKNPSTQFRPLMGIQLTEKQQCLLDNLWHIQTMPQASSFKAQVLNALSIYFCEQTSKDISTKQPKFTHYIIFRGTKTGIFNKWETVAKYIQCPGPIYKGFQNFAEALKTARETFGLNNFFIEPEEVQTFSEIAKTNPEQVIKAQETVIAKLQEQLIQQGKDTQYIQVQIENNLIKQKIALLEAKNTQLIQKLEKKEKDEKYTVTNRNYEIFRARMLDTPWWKHLEPITERFPEFENLVSQKVCTQFPLILYQLQQQLVDMAFRMDQQTMGFRIVERTDDEGNGSGLILIQIFYPTKLSDDEIIQFYHYGMIDYIELRLNPRTERLLNRFGEKFTMIVGNIAERSIISTIGCKIFSSFPYTDAYTYRPARRRIFVHSSGFDPLEDLAILKDINFANLSWLANNPTNEDSLNSFIKEHQQTPDLPSEIHWENYKLIGEGHYIQVYAQFVWSFLLPFVGESEQLKLEHIINNEENNFEDLEESGSPQSIDSTHRDF